MKKITLVFLVLAPFTGFTQWTQQQQEDYLRQMEQLSGQLEQQMSQLRDSLVRMQKQLEQAGQGNWQSFDTSGFNNRWEFEAIEPVAPVPPSAPYTEPFPGGEVYTNEDTTIVRWGRWNMIVKEGDDGEDEVRVYKSDDWYLEDHDEHKLKNIETKFLLLDVGVNNYFGKNFTSAFPGYEDFEPNPGKSWGVNLHLVNQRLNLIDHHLWLSYGLFFEFNSYKYDGDKVLIANVDSIAFQTSDVALKKNKLSCEYLGIPLMLRYESNPHHLNHSFHLSAGVFGEYLIGARTKIKTVTNDKSKVHDDYNLNPFRYGIATRAGYGWVNVFANFGLSELLKNGVEPEAFPFAAGLAFEF